MREAEDRAVGALLGSLEGLLERTAGLTRIARIAAVLPEQALGLPPDVLAAVVGGQRDDGGWASVEESIWCLGSITSFSEAEDCSVRGLEWMHAQRAANGGWSTAPRDTPNYVITALAISRVRGLAQYPDAEWLEDSWRRDMAQDVKLTYKGALYLEGMQRVAVGDGCLMEATAAYLTQEQNDDGGFGPWKDHPIGSDPWSTGMCLVGLCACPQLADRVVVERAAQWLVSAQLESGYWPYHFIDEGTAYAYWGLSEADKFLDAS